MQLRRPGAEFGGRNIFSAEPRFLNDVFWGGQIYIFAAKIYDDLFLVIDQIFLIFHFFPRFSLSLLC